MTISEQFNPINHNVELARDAVVGFPDSYWADDRPSLAAIKLGLGLANLEVEHTDSLRERIAKEGGEYLVREWGVRHKTTAGAKNTHKRVTGDIHPIKVSSNRDICVTLRNTLVDYYNDQAGVVAEPTERQDIYEASWHAPDGLEVIGTFYGLRISWCNES